MQGKRRPTTMVYLVPFFFVFFPWPPFSAWTPLCQEPQHSWSSIYCDPRQASPNCPRRGQLRTYHAYTSPSSEASDVPEVLRHVRVPRKAGLWEFVYFPFAERALATSAWTVYRFFRYCRFYLYYRFYRFYRFYSFYRFYRFYGFYRFSRY